jgi:hypothetical protein
MLSRLARAARGAAGWFAALWRAVRSVLRGDGLDTAPGRRAALILGPAAVIIGATLHAAIVLSDDIAAAVLSVVIALVWSGARLIVIRIAAPRLGDRGKAALTAAWAAGLLPYAAAVGTVLRLICWAASLLLTRRYIDRATHGAVDGLQVMLWVAGFEAAATIGIWAVGVAAPILAM